MIERERERQRERETDRQIYIYIERERERLLIIFHHNCAVKNSNEDAHQGLSSVRIAPKSITNYRDTAYLKALYRLLLPFY